MTCGPGFGNASRLIDSDVLGSFYDDTRITYSPTLRPPQMEQTINLSSSDQANFDRFLFGFTSQTAAGDNQTSTIRNFKLSFVACTHETLTCDPTGGRNSLSLSREGFMGLLTSVPTFM